MSIGNQIRELRLRHSLSQAEFAKRLEVSLQTVLRMEKNKFPPSSETLLRLARDFRVDLNWLLCGTGPRQPETSPGVTVVEGSGDDQRVVGVVDLPGVAGSMMARINGEEMFPTIRPGDYAVLVADGTGVTDGAIVAYATEWGEVRTRRYQATTGLLVSENESIPALSAMDTKIIGRVATVIRIVSFV